MGDAGPGLFLPLRCSLLPRSPGVGTGALGEAKLEPGAQVVMLRASSCLWGVGRLTRGQVHALQLASAAGTDVPGQVPSSGLGWGGPDPGLGVTTWLLCTPPR